MIDHNRFQGSVVPFARRWHVIQEIDIMPLIAAQRRRTELCARLERMADALPERPGDGEVVALARSLASGGGGDEIAFLEAMLVRRSDDPLPLVLLDHVRLRHAADAAAAQELIAALLPSVADEPRPCAETLGHMLRGLFTACRRAVQFEQLVILALAGGRLTADARELLVGALGVGLDD